MRSNLKHFYAWVAIHNLSCYLSLKMKSLFIFSSLFCLVLSQKCLPFLKCDSLLLLYKNRDNLPNLTREDVHKHLKSLLCGFDGTQNPLVHCPELEGKYLLTLINIVWKTYKKSHPRRQRRRWSRVKIGIWKHWWRFLQRFDASYSHLTRFWTCQYQSYSIGRQKIPKFGQKNSEKCPSNHAHGNQRKLLLETLRKGKFFGKVFGYFFRLSRKANLKSQIH